MLRRLAIITRIAITYAIKGPFLFKFKIKSIETETPNDQNFPMKGKSLQDKSKERKKSKSRTVRVTVRDPSRKTNNLKKIMSSISSTKID